MAIDFDSLLGRHTVADIRTAVVAAANVVSWRVSTLPGLSRLRKLALDVVPVVVEAATRINAEAIRGGILDFARGTWVDLLAINLYGLEGRIEETFATTTVTFTNNGANSYVFAVGEVTVSNGSITYKNTEPFSLAIGGQEGDERAVGVIATVIGSAGSTGAATITEMVTRFDGVSCTNEAAAHGSDRESDDSLKERCRLARSALSNSGPVDAMKLIALSAKREDGSSIGATRVQVVEHVPTMGDVSIYLADADGALEGADVDRIDYLIRTLVLPTGVNYLGASPAVEVTVNIVYSAKAREVDGFTEAELEASAEADIEAMFADPTSNPIGGFIDDGDTNGFMYRSEITAVISQTQPNEDAPRPLKHVNVTTPAADVELEPGEVAVLGTITPAITFVKGG